MAADAEYRTALRRAIHGHDRASAVRVAHEALDRQGASIGSLYDTLSEIVVEMGTAWQQGTAEVWQEHLVTGIVRTVVESCSLRVHAQAPAERQATVVVAAPDDEYHELGIRMLADRFALAGWRAHLLGANLPVEEVVAAVGELGADAIALSASTHFHRVELRGYVATLEVAFPDLRIWVGGAAFAREHAGWPDEMVLDPRSVPPPGES